VTVRECLNVKLWLSGGGCIEGAGGGVRCVENAFKNCFISSASFCCKSQVYL